MGAARHMTPEQRQRRRRNLRLAWTFGAMVLLWYLLAIFWILRK